MKHLYKRALRSVPVLFGLAYETTASENLELYMLIHADDAMKENHP